MFAAYPDADEWPWLVGAVVPTITAGVTLVLNGVAAVSAVRVIARTARRPRR